MKKIIRAIFALLVIGTFILATQISCQKSSAQSSVTSAIGSPGLILYTQQVGTTVPSDSGRTTTIYTTQYHTTNLDGTNLKTIPISLPTGLNVSPGGRLTNDGKTLLFLAYNSNTRQQYLYSCLMDGSSLKQVMNLTANSSTFEGAY